MWLLNDIEYAINNKMNILYRDNILLIVIVDASCIVFYLQWVEVGGCTDNAKWIFQHGLEIIQIDQDVIR